MSLASLWQRRLTLHKAAVESAHPAHKWVRTMSMANGNTTEYGPRELPLCRVRPASLMSVLATSSVRGVGQPICKACIVAQMWRRKSR